MTRNRNHNQMVGISTAGGLAFRESGQHLEAELAEDEADLILPSPGRLTADPNDSRRLSSESNEASTDLRSAKLMEVERAIELRKDWNLDWRPLRTLQQFEGKVTDVDGDSFWADINDLTHPDNPTEVVELSIDEIAIPDRSILRVGSVFYWIIGYETSRVGTIRRISEIRMRRAPLWTVHSLRRARERAAKRLRFFTDAQQEQSASG
jgi:hypothetical protein